MTEKHTDKKMIFVVDDEPDLQELISLNLQKSGYETESFASASPMLSLLNRKTPDLIILDLMLPDMDGFEVCKQLKGNPAFSPIPIIMVTAKTDEIDVILGLELGADDYISKPFSPRELVARVKAVLRREKSLTEPSQKPLKLAGILSIDLKKFEVYVHDERISLTSTEFMILKMLAQKPGWVFSREKILDVLEKDVFDRTIDVHVKNLRDKLGDAGKLIKNIRGVGYKLEI